MEVARVVVVKLDDRRPIILPARYATMVRHLIALMSRMDAMGAGEISFHWNARDRRHTASSVGVRLLESWPAGWTENVAGGVNVEAKEAA